MTIEKTTPIEKDPVQKAAMKYLEHLQKIQMSNPPDSLPWIQASKEINALANTMACYVHKKRQHEIDDRKRPILFP